MDSFGLTVSKNYFNEYGRPVFAERFPEIYGLLCFGLCGPGSECYGFDDEISRDHDFEPGFCVFYPEDKLTRRQVFELERAYAKLPAEYKGIRRPPVKAYGGVARRGVIGICEYFSRYLGDIGEPGSIEDWLYLSEERLCEALNGEIFVDNYGEITRLRQLLSAPPADVQKKRLAGRLFALSQDGGYNYVRALKRVDGAQARLFLDDFTAGAAACIYLLNDMYRPYRKWLIRGLERCVQHTVLIPQLNLLLTSGPEGHTETVEHISRTLAAAALIKYGLELPRAGYGDKTGFDMLQYAAFLLNDHISDNELRNTDILYAL